ncbi:IS1634 family transposase [Cupriavidus sp. D39]|uniref:IS1634 family transposase n=1 Tax=Cupriavidus sp. D39 TaxID=2997877 RepID=UPI00226FE605|nr:IS1634 family transposase [Cupriavidus sp. D39]MCY0856014.1 IS1634 family transposase [Cupriavidus sp. D39]MCY0856851.1 IS1634 family transposase [Cupriavidus sp. D39]
MFVKVTSSGSRRYVQLVESYRDDNGQPKQRTVATLGRLDQLGDSMEGVINGLLRVTGRPTLEAAAEPAVTFESARALGDVWALSELWHELGFDGLRRVFRRTRHAIDVEALVRIMVFNRLCDPESKLGVLRWLETVGLPGLSIEAVDHQHLLRAMDALVTHQAEVDAVLAGLLRPLVDQTLSVVFYDMTTIRAEGLSQQEDDVRQYGMAKEGVIARQFMLGVVQTAEGLPLYHEVFDGNTAEVTTLKPTLEKVLSRFPVKRVIVVADRGLLSIDNLAELQTMTLPDGAPLEFILAVPGRRYNDVVDSLEGLHAQQCLPAREEVLGEVPWNGLRLIVAHDPVVAQEKGAQRDAQIAHLEQLAAQWVGKLDAQDTGHRSRGKKLSDGGARARFYHAVCEAHLARIIQVDLKSERFCYAVDERALHHARMMDGKLLLVTNAADLSPREVVDRYKSLADIERGFRVLKSEIEIGPVYHRLPDRIRAHAAICFMALILYRVMRMRLQAANSELSPARALTMLNRIQHHRIVFDQTKSVAGLSTISQEQARVFSALKVRKPVKTSQLTLL